MPAAWASDTLTVSGDMAINEDITVSDVVFTSGGTLAVGEYSAANGDAFVGGDYILNVIAAP